MRKAVFFLIMGCIISTYSFSQSTSNVTVTIEVTNIEINNGTVYLAIFSNAESFRKEEPFLVFLLDADNTKKSQVVSLLNGEYVISAFQDTNNNQQLDFGLFGVPRELVGISNYNGRGFPSRNFDKQKVLINNTTERLSIGLYKFW
jgi:uncharacterized protein (DUF2141 family)